MHELVPNADEAELDNPAMSAFEGTLIERVLRDKGIVSVAVCGVATEVAIDITLRHAVEHGFLPIPTKDACVAGDEDAGKRAAETLQLLGDTTVTTVQEYASALKERGAGG